MITGAASDSSLAQQIASLMHGAPFILCGQTTLGQMAALMAKVSLVISNDSGPMHIAAARKIALDSGYSFNNSTAIVSIFGSTDPEIYGYDSFRTGYAEANQKAPSKIFLRHCRCNRGHRWH